MKKNLLIICSMVLSILMFAGCGNAHGKWNADKNSLLEFDYGCTIEEAEEYFGLTSDDREPDTEKTEGTAYVYDIKDWNLGADALYISASVETVGDKTFPMGVDCIRFIFVGDDNEKKMVDFYQKQMDLCKNKYQPENKKDSKYYAYGDWASYKDCSFISYITALDPVDMDIEPNLCGKSFDPKEWNEICPLVDSYYYNLGKTFNNEELSNTNYLEFRGVFQTYVENNKYFDTKATK